MPRARHFDPPLTYREISRVYAFTTKVLDEILGMPAWRIQIQSAPCPSNSYATIKPVENKMIGEMALSANWEDLDLEDEKVPTLLHEMLHLTHFELTYQISERAYRFVPSAAYSEFHDSWNRAIELWTDHMTQIILGQAADLLEQWRKEIWDGEAEEQEAEPDALRVVRPEA